MRHKCFFFLSDSFARNGLTNSFNKSSGLYRQQANQYRKYTDNQRRLVREQARQRRFEQERQKKFAREQQRKAQDIQRKIAAERQKKVQKYRDTQNKLRKKFKDQTAFKNANDARRRKFEKQRIIAKIKRDQLEKLKKDKKQRDSRAIAGALSVRQHLKLTSAHTPYKPSSSYSSFKDFKKYHDSSSLKTSLTKQLDIQRKALREQLQKIAKTREQPAGNKISKTFNKAAEKKQLTDTQKQAQQNFRGNNLPALYDVKLAAKQLLDNGKISLDRVKAFVPQNSPNLFRSSNTIGAGQKYQFGINGKKVEVKFHSPDANAAAKFPASNSGSSWTAQIKIGNKFLGSDGKFYRRPNNLTHILLKDF